MILNDPIEEWPKSDAVISFYSQGFPIDKAIRYVKSQKNVVQINDLESQKILWDRRKMYKVLQEIKVPMTRNFTVDRPG